MKTQVEQKEKPSRAVQSIAGTFRYVYIIDENGMDTILVPVKKVLF